MKKLFDFSNSGLILLNILNCSVSGPTKMIQGQKPRRENVAEACIKAKREPSPIRISENSRKVSDESD